jgi:uncharacterized membrane protein YhhN
VTTTAWVLLAIAAVLAVGDWAAVARRDKRLEYACKPAALLALVLVALALDPENEARRAWFVAALVLSLAGDVFLMLPRDLFVAGLVSFLLGHVAYIVGLRVDGGSLGALAVAGAVVAVVAAAVGSRVVAAVRRGPQRALTAPVVTYMVVISAMVACALATGNVLAATGGALFFASDALIAWNRFVRPLVWAPVAIMVTYHLGQAGLATSLVR